jgi:NAD(P)-dependent dehydrogenase (short-subunit alcohol dehydrogenase family)
MGPLDQADPLELIKDIDTKVVGYLRSTKKSVPYMKKGQWGRIINIGGLAARTAGAISGMRNLALVHLTKTLSNELGQFGITANIIHPGATRTERTQPMQENIAHTQGLSVEDIEKKATQFIDIQRMVEAEEIASLAVFLCSPRASAITGESIAAGGGVGTAVFS